MTHNVPQVIIDLQEYQSLKKKIEELSAPGIGEELTPAESQEAAGRLLYIALNNPGIFRVANSSKQPLDLGKYTATIVRVEDQALVKFNRK